MQNLEESLARTKVLILKEYFTEYADMLEKTEEYTDSDPSASLLKVRQILERLSKEIWKADHSDPAPSIFEIFNNSSIKEKIPHNVLHRIHSLRVVSNGAIHNQNVTKADVLLCIEHLYIILDWFGRTFKQFNSLPVPVAPALSFPNYIKALMRSKIMWAVGLLLFNLTTILIGFYNYFPPEISRLFKATYEGAFIHGVGQIPSLIISGSFSFILLIVTSLLSWYLFRKFRTQDTRSMFTSFLLMYILVFSSQYIIMVFLDVFTRFF